MMKVGLDIIMFRQLDTLIKVSRILAINSRDLLINNKIYRTMIT